MTGAMKIALNVPSRIDRVTLAIAPLDRVTGAVVRSGVTARVEGLPDRAIVNASGLLVFINLPDRPSYQLEVDGRGAGFVGVEHVTFTPPAPGNRDPEARRCVVLLTPGPGYAFAPGSTLVRGVVARGAVPIAGAAISATAAGGSGAFAARSTDRGAFALALRLPPLGSHEEEKPVPVTLKISAGPDSRTLVRPVASGRGHSFLEPIDLTGSNEPGFFAT